MINKITNILEELDKEIDELLDKETDETLLEYYNDYIAKKINILSNKMQKIKVGDLIYRVYPDGKKSLGIACSVQYKSKNPYNFVNTNLKWDGFYSLETYNKYGKVFKFTGYGKGDYKYEKYMLLPI